MRIVGGRFRGKKLSPPENKAIRPTADRTRESLFNILAHGGASCGGRAYPQDAVVLDAFAGTGALGLEAASRGAALVDFLEMDRQACSLIQRNIKDMKLQGECSLITANAIRPGRPPAGRQYDLVLMDPPYNQGLGEAALIAFRDQDWLADDCLIVLELDKKEAFQLPEGYELLDERTYGKAKLLFLQTSS